MERVEGGKPLKRRSSVEGVFTTYPEFDIDQLPCICENPKVRTMKRGRENHAIYWMECKSCGRQWTPALCLSVAAGYYVFSMVSDRDPYVIQVTKKKKPKIKCKPQPKEKERVTEQKTLTESKEVLRVLTYREKRLKLDIADLKEKKGKKR